MDCFVARQPILDTQLNVFAYELLFRSGLDNFYNGSDGDKASSDVLTNIFILNGLEELTSGKKASINFTKNLLVQEVATLFPNDKLLIEITGTLCPDERTVQAIRNLKRAGYGLALDGFTLECLRNPLLDLVDIVKVDFSKTSEDQRKRIPIELKSKKLEFASEKVETAIQFNQALDWGYNLFQGYFFSHPVIHTTHTIPGTKLVYLRVLKEIEKPETDLDEIDKFIRQDVSLSYKLLRFINSAYFGLFQRIHSIRHALALLGVRETKKWIALTAITGLASDKPGEIIINSLVRARLCELLAPTIGLGDRSSELFLMGMFSLIDAIMNMSMSAVLSKIPLTSDTKIALLGGDNRFRDVYETLLSYERGEWDRFSKCASKIELVEEDFARFYYESLKWVNQVLELASPSTLRPKSAAVYKSP